MIPPPEITSLAAHFDYLQAVHKVTGVWQTEAAHRRIEIANPYIAKMWPLTFTEEQQQAIIVEFTARRLSST